MAAILWPATLYRGRRGVRSNDNGPSEYGRGGLRGAPFGHFEPVGLAGRAGQWTSLEPGEVDGDWAAGTCMLALWGSVAASNLHKAMWRRRSVGWRPWQCIILPGPRLVLSGRVWSGYRSSPTTTRRGPEPQARTRRDPRSMLPSAGALQLQLQPDRAGTLRCCLLDAPPVPPARVRATVTAARD